MSMAYTTDDRRDSRAVDTMFDAYFYNGLGMKARVSLRTEGYGSVATITLGPHNDSTSLREHNKTITIHTYCYPYLTS